MDKCCIVGCFNRPTKRGELKLYTIPTANSSRPFKVKRRELWLEAIDKANGSISDLGRDARICSAHFISGQLSLEMSDPDFVPSVFPNKLLRSREGTRNERQRPQIASAPEAPNVAPKKKAQRKQEKPQEPLHDSPNIVLMESEHCKPLEDEDILEEKDEIQQPSEVKPTDMKKPVLLLKSIVGPPGWFRCEICNDHFSNSSMLVKHIRHYHQEKSGEERLVIDSEECEKTEPNLSCEEILEEEPSFKCNMCDRSFPTVHNLKRHKLLHVRDPRKCTQCGTLFCKRHNHVFVQPQISTETIFEEKTATDETLNVSNENQTAETESDSSGESSDSMDTTEEQLETDAQPKSVPAATCNPRQPKLLTAFMSFLTESPNEEESSVENRKKRVTSSKSVESIQPESPTKDSPDSKPIPEPPAQPEASTTTTATTTNASNTLMTTTITATTQASPPKPEKPSLVIKPNPSQVFQKVEKSTVCLSFSKPLPSNVLKDFVTFISKSEASKSMTPRLIAFQAVKPSPEPVQPKQKLIPVPVTLTTLPKLPQASSDLIVKRTEPGTPFKIAAKQSSSSIFSPASLDKKPLKHAAPKSEYVHSARPPSPVPIPCKILRGPWELPPPDYPKDFVQPHLPRIPALPPTLQMFSPQFLTSTLFDVKRNYDYILSNIK